MIVKQVTVSLENRMGSLEEILKILADNDINLTAINLADAGKEGVFRMMAGTECEGNSSYVSRCYLYSSQSCSRIFV